MSNKTKFFFGGLFFGVLLCLTVIAGWQYLPSKFDTEKPLTFEQALTRIKNKEVDEAAIKPNTLEINMKSGEKFTAEIDASDATRELVFMAARETGTSVTLEPASAGLGWIMLVNTLPIVLTSLLIGAFTAFFGVLYYNHLNRKVEK